MNKIYYNNKYVESIIYDLQLQKKIENKMYLEPDFLIHLNNYINLNKQQHFIDNSLKEKIFALIHYIRFGLGYNENEIYNKIINEIIIKLNKINNQNTISFYYNQANIRANDSSTTTPSEKIERLFEIYDMIYKSISYDFQVLKDLYKDPNKFMKILNTYIANGWFLSSIKGMYAENSKMFEEEQVRINLNNVITENEKKLKKSLLIRSNKEIKKQILKR